jgi:hypothetical protein
MIGVTKSTLSGAILIITLLIGVELAVNRGTYESIDPDAVALSSPGEGMVDPDVPALVTMAEQSRRAQQVAADATLRQIIVDLEMVTFFYTDATATQEFVVKVPVAGGPTGPDRLTVEITDPTVAHYVGRPVIDLKLNNLRIGPDRVEQAITQHAPDCDFSHLVLYPDGDVLTWVAFCAMSDGLVSGWMDNQTGVFHPEVLAPWPSIASPVP